MLDELDRRMLQLLAADARAPVASMAEQLHVSRATAFNRLRRLRETGVITGFTVKVDRAWSARPVAAILLLHGGQGAQDQLRAQLLELAWVERADYVSGGVDIVLHVRAQSVDELSELILKQVRALPGVRGTQTLVVLDPVVERTVV